MSNINQIELNGTTYNLEDVLAKATGDKVNHLVDVSKIDIISNITFVKGSLNSSNGAEVTSDTRIRSEYIDVSNVKAVHFKPATGYKFALYCYTALGTYGTSSTIGQYYSDLTGWQTAERDVSMTPMIKYMRILIADTSNSNSISVADALKLSVTIDYPLMHQQRKSQYVDDFVYNWLDAEKAYVDMGVWTQGIPNPGTDDTAKKINSSTTRLWSEVIDVPSFEGTFEITANTSYKIAYYLYDSSWNMVKHAFWMSPTVTVDLASTYKYLVVGLSKSDDSAILPSAGTNVTLSFIPTGMMTGKGMVQNAGDINAELDLKWEIGSLIPGTGMEQASPGRIRSRYIYVGKGTKLVLTDTTKSHLIYTYDLYKNYVSDSSWTAEPIIIPQDCYIRILVRKYGDATITEDDKLTVASTEKVYRAFPQSLMDTVDNENNVIPQYFETQVSSAISTVRNNVFSAGRHGDSFVFITDVHWQTNARHSPSLIKRVLDNVNVGKTICGGDLIGGGTKSDMITLMSDCVSAFRNIPRFYTIFGNHDSNKIGTQSSDNYFTEEETYALMQKESDFIMEYGDVCYFYFDNPTTKTRYICLDTGEEGTTLSSSQSTWLSSTLNAMPSGYHALIFAHIIYQTTTTWHVGLTTSELARTAFMDSVCTILDTFNSSNADKKVEAIFGGHVHIDCNFSTSGGIPIILTDCDARQTFTETSAGSGTANHAAGTVNEQCFDVVTIDYTSKTIKCVRVGRGSNRTISY